MTLFPDGTKERLHGHNYEARVSFEFAPASESVERFYDFACIKKSLATVCNALNEHMLLPMHQQRVKKISADEVSTEVVVCGKRYVFPTDEVVWLPISNIVVEELSRHLWYRLEQLVGDDLVRAGIGYMEVSVSETPGQGASFGRCVIGTEKECGAAILTADSGEQGVKA